jgi:hypothetical protein
MNRAIIYFIMISLVSCYTTSTVSPLADFSKYRYAVIGSDIDGGAILYEAQIQVQNSLQLTGYKIIADTRVKNLESSEQVKVIIITMALTSTVEKTTCVINIRDYMSGFILASCKGVYGFGWDMEDDQRNPIKKAISEMETVLRTQ